MKRLLTFGLFLWACALIARVQAQYPDLIEYHGVWTARTAGADHVQVVGGTVAFWTGRGRCDHCDVALRGYITMTNAETGVSFTNRFDGPFPTARLDSGGSLRQLTTDSVFNIGGSLRVKTGGRYARGTWYVNLAPRVE